MFRTFLSLNDATITAPIERMLESAIRILAGDCFSTLDSCVEVGRGGKGGGDFPAKWQKRRGELFSLIFSCHLCSFFCFCVAADE